MSFNFKSCYFMSLFVFSCINNTYVLSLFLKVYNIPTVKPAYALIGSVVRTMAATEHLSLHHNGKHFAASIYSKFHYP